MDAKDLDKKPKDDEIKHDKPEQEVPEEKRNRRLEMNRIAAQRSRQRKKEKMLSLSEAVSRLTEENNRLNLENRCLAQTQADQEQELLRSKDNTLLMQRYISIMDLSLQCVTTQLLLAKGEQPTEEKVDLTALRLTQSVSAMMKQVKTQQLHQQHLHQRLHQMKQQLRRQNGMQVQEPDHKASSLQQSNKMLGQTQASAARNNLLQQLESPLALRASHQNNSQMFAPKPMGMVSSKPSPLNNSPLLRMRKQFYANRMNSALSNPSARGNNIVGGGAFGATPRNPNLPFSGLPGYSGGNVGDKSSFVGRLAGGMAGGLPGMSSSLMNTMKYMPGMSNPMNEPKPSLLGGMGGMDNSLGGMSAHLGNMTRTGTGMDTPNSVGSVNNAMAGLTGMRGPNLSGLKDMLDTPNNRQIPVGQKLLQQTVLNHMLQSQQQQKKRQGKFHATINSPPKRGRLDPNGSLVKPADLAEAPKLPTPESSAPAAGGFANADLIQPATPSKTADSQLNAGDSQLNAASTLTRMLDEFKPPLAE